MRRALRILLGLILIAALVPLVLTPVYRFVDPVSTLMLYERLRGRPVERRRVDLGHVAPVMLRALVTAEDARYCRHHGVDWEAIDIALEEDRDNPRGASTIAMQTVKNLFLWQSRSYVRKVLEVPLALYADLVLGKRRLLEIYLNVAEWGRGTFGIEAAARRHFGLAASDLDARQAALLAAMLPSPLTRDPRRPTGAYATLARTIERRMVSAPADTGCLRPF
jgi:monofunctional biosynthetic peptidoglycan transglycosylase